MLPYESHEVAEDSPEKTINLSLNVLKYFSFLWHPEDPRAADTIAVRTGESSETRCNRRSSEKGSEAGEGFTEPRGEAEGTGIVDRKSVV